MPVRIGNYEFEGPFADSSLFNSRPGIFAIICKGKSGLRVIDLGAGSNLKAVVGARSKKEKWPQHCDGVMSLCALYTDGLAVAQGKLVEELRAKYKPPCGHS